MLYFANMITRIYFIRHAEARSNVDRDFTGDAALTENGILQAELTAGCFKHKKIDGLYTSKILRARQTADAISKVAAVEPVIIEFIKERKVSYASPDQWANIESFDDLMLRLAETKRFLENLPDGRFVFVSHAIFMRALAAYLMFGEQITEDMLTAMNKTLLVDHTGVSKLSHSKENGRWHIESWNDLGHLS
ncbi:MAG: histidine phosphatase family protein [Candidatus Taylorbacteria bacterium]|nr:histidine phosphatase family protein [Candidatus Taylorbacteria bacterium]